jgi:hypothetical protein
MPPKTSKRATLADAEAMLLELTGADAETLGTVLVEMVAAYKAKAAEEAAEKPESEAMAVEPQSEGDAPAAARALPGFADDAEQEAFVSMMLNALRDLFGQPEATPAQVLELFTASAAAFKGALGTAAPPADAGADQSAMTAPDDAAARTIARLTAELGKRDFRAAIAKRAAEAKATLAEADLEQLATDALGIADAGARERAIVSALRAAQSVPTGEVFGRRESVAAHEDFGAAWRSLVPEIEKAHPGEAPHVTVARAQKLARGRFPQFNA